MPSLNRGRAIARFNSGKQCFEDLKIDSLGKMVVVDMVNGGGKSFFIQCLGQTIIPNSTWQKDWAFSSVFEPSNKNTVVHCVTEWELEEGMGYKYLLAGFAASKTSKTLNSAGEEVYGDFDRLSYICLYDERNENDIFNLPLREVDENGVEHKMSIPELRKYLASIKSSTYYTETFTSARDYKRRLAQYNITEAEWELIKGVNADEKYVATYLRQFSTSESFILKFLIPKIEECNSSRPDVDYQDKEALATSLLNIREHMDKLIKKKAQSGEYTKIIGFLELVSRKLIDIESKYIERDNLYIEIKKSILFLEEKLSSLKESIELNINNIEKESALLREYDVKLKGIDIYNIEQKLLTSNSLLISKEKEYEKIKSDLIIEEKKLLLKKKENSYHSILEDRFKKEGYIAKIATIESNSNDLIGDRDTIGQKVKNYLYNRILEIDQDLDNLKNKLHENNTLYKSSQANMTELHGKVVSAKDNILRLENNLKRFVSQMDSPSFSNIKNIEKSIHSKVALEENLERIAVTQDSYKNSAKQYKTDIENLNNNINNIKMDNTNLSYKFKDLSNKLDSAQTLKDKLDILISKNNAKDLDDLKVILENRYVSKKEEERQLIEKIAETKALISNLQNHSLTLSKDTKQVYTILSKAYSTALLGKDFLEGLDSNEKSHFIQISELIPYSILLDNKDFNKFIKNKDILANYFGNAVPVINRDSLSNPMFFPEGIKFTSKNLDFYVNEDSIRTIREEKKRELVELDSLRIYCSEDVKAIYNEISIINEFIKNYTSYDSIDELAKEIAILKGQIAKNTNDIKDYETLKISLESDILTIENNLIDTEKEYKDISKKILSLEKYLDIQNSYIAESEELNSIKEIKDKESKKLEDIKIKISEIEKDKIILEEERKSLESTRFFVFNDYEKISFIKENDDAVINEKEYILLSNKLNAIIDRLKGINSDLDIMEKEIISCDKRIENYIKDITQDGISLDELSHITLDFTKNSPEVIATLQDFVNNMKLSASDTEKVVLDLKMDVNNLSNSFKIKTELLVSEFNVNYEDMKTTLDNLLKDKTIKDIQKEFKENIKNSKSIIKNLTAEKDSLFKELNSTKDIKNEFMIISKDIDVEIGNCNNDITAIRDAKTIESSVSIIKKSITSKINSYKREVEKGYDLVQYMTGLEEIIEGLYSLPNTSKEIKDIINNIISSEDEDRETIISMIRKEQSSIDSEIASLELQESTFVTHCIQKSENVLRDIKKLTELSVIELNGRSQEILRVNLQKLDDTLMREKMTNYIENLIAVCEHYTDESERKAEISKGLSIDKLFLQIIKPIKSNSIEIFKLEDNVNIHVNNWLSWNRAYGSKGQTNGMYISVLICIISYIRKLYTSSTDTSKKVIILDNPFSGTTSEIIWLPILKLLKANNVQLWAFGYEIKTQLSDCFDTRYFLVKEPSKGYENIIVNEFKSNLDLSSLKYDVLTGKKVEYRQEGFNLDALQ